MSASNRGPWSKNIWTNLKQFEGKSNHWNQTYPHLDPIFQNGSPKNKSLFFKPHFAVWTIRVPPLPERCHVGEAPHSLTPSTKRLQSNSLISQHDHSIVLDPHLKRPELQAWRTIIYEHTSHPPNIKKTLQQQQYATQRFIFIFFFPKLIRHYNKL